MTNWHTVATAAEYARGSATKVREAIKAGHLKSFRYGKTDIRLREEDLDAWLEAIPYDPEAAS